MVVALDSHSTGFFHIRYDVIVDIWVYPSIRVYVYWVFCLMVVALDSHTTGFFHIRYDVIVDIWVYPSIRVYVYWVFCLMVVALDSHTTVFSYCVVRIINGEIWNYLWGIM
jgi:hypothetical protein